MTFVGSGDAKVYKDLELSRDDFGILSDEVNISSPSSCLLTSYFVLLLRLRTLRVRSDLSIFYLSMPKFYIRI